MWRGLAGVVLGYIVMAAFVFGTFSVAFVTIGSERAFQAGSYEVTTLWIVVSLVLSFVAALLGGAVCGGLTGSQRAPFALALLVLILGVAMAVPVLQTPEDAHPPVREGPVGNMEAMQQARQPDWVVLANPIIGALGVLLGARMRRPRAI